MRRVYDEIGAGLRDGKFYFRIFVNPPLRYLRALLDEKIDIGFIHPPVELEDIEILTLLCKPIVVALPCNQPLTKQETISFAATD